MTYSAILVHVQDGPAAQHRLQCARQVADMFSATLIGIGVETVPPMIAGPMSGFVQADWYVAASSGLQEALKAAEVSFWQAAEGLARGGVWKRGMDFPGQVLARASRSADLIVASPTDRASDSVYSDAPAADLVIASGRPVLVAPLGLPSFQADRILVAWKDGREARRALADALPFLKRAQAVQVLELCDKADHVDANTRNGDVVDGLRRHGVKVSGLVMEQDGDAGGQILANAVTFKADLIVAGAYGHSRFGEWAFGGVTRELMAQTDFYVMFSH